MKNVFLAIVMLLMTSPIFAQGTQTAQSDMLTSAELNAMVELLRSDIRTRKVAILGEVLQLTDSEAQKFWPIYREYDNELSKIGDQRLGLIKAFARSYETMTDKKAGELAKGILDLMQKRVDLKKKYFGKISKVLPAIKAAQFLQIENRIDALIDLQLASEVPIIQN